ILMISVCTSTITGPIDSVLRYSTRNHIYLLVTSLQLPNYQQRALAFKNNKITNTLVENYRGYKRVLEVLNDCLAGHNIKECNIDTLMNNLHYNFTKKYRNAIFVSVKEARPI
ncbi:21868_t:CDS:1, partial [Racocetra persica]